MDERSHQKRQSYVKKYLKQDCCKICSSPFFCLSCATAQISVIINENNFAVREIFEFIFQISGGT